MIGYGDKRQPRRIDAEEHHHRVRRRVFLAVQLLQLLHRLQTHRRRGVVESEEVRREVHEYRPCRRVPRRDAGEELAEDRGRQPRKRLHHAPALAYLHNAHPERQHARQPQRYLETRLCRGEGRIDYLVEYLHVARQHQPPRRHHKGDEEEPYPYIVQYHDSKNISFYTKNISRHFRHGLRGLHGLFLDSKNREIRVIRA